MPPRPKNCSLPGRCVLTPLGTGRLRPSISESLIPGEREERPLADDRDSPPSAFLVL